MRGASAALGPLQLIAHTAVAGRTEEEILNQSALGRLKIVIQASTIYAGVFVFFFLASKALALLFEGAVALRDRFRQPKAKEA